MKWWERWPDRFDHEMRCLSAHGLGPVDTSTAEEMEAGYRSIVIDYPFVDGQPIPVSIKFPPEYPFFMAFAFLDPNMMLLRRHQNPTTGELCLLNAGQSWQPSHLMGDEIITMLPKILKIHEDPHGPYAKEQEVEQGEPLTGYFTKDNGSFLLIEDMEIPEDFSHGTFEASILASDRNGSRYALTKITNALDGQSITASKKLIQSLKGYPIQRGNWRRLEIGLENAPKNERDFSTLAAKIDRHTWHTFERQQRPSEDLLLALFQEEVQQGTFADAWLGIQLRTVFNRSRGKGNKKGGSSNKQGQFVFGARYDTKTRWARSPELQALEDKNVCLVGAGMLGSPIALQLARAGVGRLSIVDPDYVELATIIRYGLGAQYAGRAKVEALKDYIRRNYVFVQVNPIQYRLGVPFPGECHNHEKFLAAVEAADLVIDAAAEKNVSYYLNDLLSSLQKPWITVTTRPGSWGGETWIMQPGGPCWSCLEAHNNDESLPMPNGDADRGLQIGGCSQLTTTGNGFDSDIYALNTVRAAIGLLTPDGNGYPSPNWNAMVMNLRGETGDYIGPEFTPYTMPYHPSCDCN